MPSDVPEDPSARLREFCLQWRELPRKLPGGHAIQALVESLEPVLDELQMLRLGREAAVTCGWCNHHTGAPDHCQCTYWCGFIDCWRNGEPGTPDYVAPSSPEQDGQPS